MRRFLLFAAVAAAALVVPAAQADPPLIVPAPGTDFTDTTCGFPVQVHYTTNGETAKIFSDGTVIVTGPLKATFSANGKSVSLNIAGPAMFRGDTAVGDGVGVGPVLLPNGTKTLAYSAGQVGDITTVGVPLHGHMLLDICVALAPS
jgi:hypothetical protein